MQAFAIIVGIIAASVGVPLAIVKRRERRFRVRDRYDNEPLGTNRLITKP